MGGTIGLGVDLTIPKVPYERDERINAVLDRIQKKDGVKFLEAAALAFLRFERDWSGPGDERINSMPMEELLRRVYHGKVAGDGVANSDLERMIEVIGERIAWGNKTIITDAVKAKLIELTKPEMKKTGGLGVARAAMLALGRIGAEEARPVLEERLYYGSWKWGSQRSLDRFVRREAAIALALFGANGAFNALSRKLEAGDSSEVHGIVALGLAAMGALNEEGWRGAGRTVGKVRERMMDDLRRARNDDRHLTGTCFLHCLLREKGT